MSIMEHYDLWSIVNLILKGPNLKAKLIFSFQLLVSLNNTRLVFIFNQSLNLLLSIMDPKVNIDLFPYLFFIPTRRKQTAKYKVKGWSGCHLRDCFCWPFKVSWLGGKQGAVFPSFQLGLSFIRWTTKSLVQCNVITLSSLKQKSVSFSL